MLCANLNYQIGILILKNRRVQPVFLQEGYLEPFCKQLCNLFPPPIDSFSMDTSHSNENKWYGLLPHRLLTLARQTIVF